MFNSVVLIPAYMPSEVLLNVIKDLIALKVDKIVVVRDGGGVEFDDIFNKIKLIKECHLVEHSQNMGKGVALKSGFKYILQHFPNCIGCVTADADGQHLPNDIVNILKVQEKNNNSFILGVRNFDNKVPFRSKIGNYITKWLLSIVLFKSIKDTQTGLRGISSNFMNDLLNVDGDKYEFELNMILHAKRLDYVVEQHTIETIYIENNKSSHFNPLIDSIKIYFVLFKFITSSTISFLIDYSLFLFFFYLSSSFLLSFSLSRSISLFVNYYVNKNIVFRYYNKHNLIFPILKYATLVAMNFFIVYSIIEFFNNNFNINIPVLKLFVELCMFFINFFIQKHLVFPKKKNIQL